MRPMLRQALFSAALFAAAILFPATSHASLGVDSQVDNAMYQDRLQMAKSTVGEKEDNLEQIGDIDKVNPKAKKDQLVDQWQQQTAQSDQLPKQGQMFGSGMFSSLMGMMNSIGSNGGGFGSSGLGMISGLMKSENTAPPDGSCKIAAANPDKAPAEKPTASILASPIAATLLATPIQAGGGSGVCGQGKGLLYCKDKHWQKQNQPSKTTTAMKKAPMNDQVQKCNGHDYKCDGG